MPFFQQLDFFVCFTNYRKAYINFKPHLHIFFFFFKYKQNMCRNSAIKLQRFIIMSMVKKSHIHQ